MMQALDRNAALSPDKVAVRFVGAQGEEEETITFAALRARVEASAADMCARGLQGKRLVLARQNSIATMVDLLAAVLAGATAVPVDPRLLRSATSLERLLQICSPAVLATDVGEEAGDAAFAVAMFGDLPRMPGPTTFGSNPTDPALLQFTSGSTSEPKGVTITQANLVSNVDAINASLRLGSDDLAVSWLPMFHDMGLMLGAIWPVVSGASVVLMRPSTFVARPATWLRTISRYRATVSSAPNFGYQLCLDRISDDELRSFDLSSWRIAICGAEPVRATTVRSFNRRFARVGLRPQALTPCYGLAEATVFVSGHASERSASVVDFDERQLGEGRATSREASEGTRPLVSCGKAAADVTLRIVGDDDRCVPDGEVGEIVVAGPGVSGGYYRAEEATRAAFGLSFAGEDGGFLRTGDLGFLHAGELFVAGRAKDLVIVRGANHHPADIEATCRGAAPELSTCECAAFATTDADGATLVVELPRRHGPDAGRLAAAIRRDVGVAHGLALDAVAFVAPRRLPRTTSGKLRRRETAELWRRGQLATTASFVEAGQGRARAAPRLGPRAVSSTEEAVAAAWSEVLGIADVPRDANFFEMGGDSIRVAAVHARLVASCAGRLALSDLFAHPTVAALAAHIEAAEGSSLLEEARRRGRRRAERHLDRRIAIVGMAGRFPGAGDLGAYWRLLLEGRVAGAPHPAAPRAASLEGSDLFDAAFFGIPAVEARQMDPQQRILLECVQGALEAAGCVPASTSGAIGTFVGCGMNPHRLPLLDARLAGRDAAERWGAILGNDKDYLASRIAYKLRLTGPSLTIQTACSTSLVAVHAACQSLLAGECDVALAGGVAIGGTDVPGGSRVGDVFSSSGRCRPFDAAADGTVFGEGCGVVVLKRLADAVADRDHVHAVVLGSATNNDGAARLGFSAPGVLGQAVVVAEALAAAGVHAEEVGYVEAHGTGTPMGDPVELAALTRAFRADTSRKGYCALGSVKANVGHLTAAAGVAGLIKAVLALENGLLPPQANFDAPSASLDLSATPFKICKGAVEWSRTGVPRVAGVSSFGMGGTNAHVVLGEAPSASHPREARAELLLLSTKSAEALDRAASSLAVDLGARPGIALADVACSLSRGRPEYAHRRALVACSAREAAQAFAAYERRGTAAPVQAMTPVVFAVPGAGSQRLLMGAAVRRREEVYRKSFDRCCAALSDGLGFDLGATILDDGAGAARMMSRVEVAQPALFAVSIALAALWRSWGVEPAAVLGHSFGEIAAACVAGVFELEDAARFVALRSRLVAATPEGAMLAVLARREDFEDALAPGLSIACLNGEASHVVSGPRPLVEALDARLSGAGTLCRPVVTDRAFHSALMDDAVRPLVDHLANVRMRSPRLPMISGVTGDWIGAEAATPGYWGRHLREPVRFADGLRTLAACDARVLLEVGPGRVLCRLAQQAFPDGRILGIAGLPDADGGDREVVGLLRAAGDLWVRGCTRSGRDLAPAEGWKVALPTHPMSGRSYVLPPDARPWTLDEAAPQRAPALIADSASRYDAAPYLAEVYVPGDGPGAAVSAAWCEVLELPHVAIDEDFFDLGGHSLLAARLADRLSTTLGMPVSAADVIRHPTPRRMVQHLKPASPGQSHHPPFSMEPAQ